MSEKVREADFELKYRVWELESLYDVGLSIAGTLDLESLADEILMKSVSLLNARSGTLVVRPGAAPDGEPQVLIRSIGTPLVDDGAAPDPEGRVLICNRREDRPPALAGAPAEKLLAVPISSDGRPLGLLVVADKENRAGGSTTSARPTPASSRSSATRRRSRSRTPGSTATRWRRRRWNGRSRLPPRSSGRSSPRRCPP
ncbi:MAG: GAF domain-containing protein [Holophagales bacterium]|nr:GAF domain-containing protein [Holophagales bacterium]